MNWPAIQEALVDGLIALTLVTVAALLASVLSA